MERTGMQEKAFDCDNFSAQGQKLLSGLYFVQHGVGLFEVQKVELC